MKIALVTRSNVKEKWGGDLVAFQTIRDGMEALGHDAHLIDDPEKVAFADFVFLANTCLDLRACRHFLHLMQKQYGLIGFHENHIKFWGPSIGFYHYVQETLRGAYDEGLPFSLEHLYENPQLIHYYSPPPIKKVLWNYEVLKNARVCIANSPTEAETMRRDCPSCQARVVYWSAGIAESVNEKPDEKFLAFSGLENANYILQIGRFEPKKNQLATILATKDFDLPLVFIAANIFDKKYFLTCMEAVQKWRKGPTLILSQELPSTKLGNVTIQQLPKGIPLSKEMLLSAIAHAALHIHPAFYELPGYTYLEAAKMGTPTIASSWTTIRDYFTDEKTGEYSLDHRIEYCLPYDIPAMTQLIWKKIGERFPFDNTHPVFSRTRIDVARDILALIK